MIEPQIPDDEADRLETLRALRIIDTAPEERFDRLTRMARRMFGVPISLVSLVDSDRQWFKSKQGLDAQETPRNISFCGHAIMGDELFLVPDTADDERFHDNPLVTDGPNIRFYAGYPLRVANGHKMGTLCLIDDKPRELSQDDKDLLRDLVIMVEQEIAAVQLATLDELTMISNRRGFMALAKHAISMCRRNNKPATLLIIDLDDFKPVNDKYGHVEGDRALIAFSNILRQSLRDSDVIGRVGGDEFAVMLTGAEQAQLEVAIERLRQDVATYNHQAARGYDIKFSVGSVIMQSGEAVSVDELMAKADALMYENKGDGNH